MWCQIKLWLTFNVLVLSSVQIPDLHILRTIRIDVLSLPSQNHTMNTPTSRNALLSASAKTDELLDYARVLATKYDFTLYASGGTRIFLERADLTVVDVANLTKYGPVLGHRVVTLAPQVHGGLLATDEMRPELDALGWPKFDLLHCDFYPLADVLGAVDTTLASCLEKTDIGGPAMVRSAVKGGGRIVTTDQGQFPGVIRWLEAGEPDKSDIINVLRGRAEQAVALYCTLSAEVYSTYCNLNAGTEFGL